MGVVWNSDYYNAHICELAALGLASVATKRGTSEVWFRRLQGAAWSTPVLVGTLTTGKAAQILQKSQARSATLMVSNGIDNIWQSRDFGRTWEAV